MILTYSSSAQALVAYGVRVSRQATVHALPLLKAVIGVGHVLTLVVSLKNYSSGRVHFPIFSKKAMDLVGRHPLLRMIGHVLLKQKITKLPV